VKNNRHYTLRSKYIYLISCRLRDKYKKYGSKTRDAKLTVAELNIAWQQAG